ncbi:MAG TPA: Gfo/Idh/MocA family oxidoreductase [Candidatus Brocadiia bacterium]|nr:Gfo/Idh/MocA family oxidoreductase [Candidatus Brocadiia bacterium]
MKEVKIACYGMSGHQILGHMPHLKRARLVAVSGIDRARFDDLKEKLPQAMGDAAFVESLDALLADKGVDLISFCSSRRDEQQHQVVAALKAGKHVLAEKPMALSLEQLAALRQAAKLSGKQLRTMNPMIYDADFWGMKQVVDSGAIGEIVQVYAMKSYPYNDSRPQDEGVDGGMLMQAGIHAVSFIRFVTGLEFEEIFAQDTQRGNPKPGELRMAANVACRLKGGALACIVVNYCNPKPIGFHGNDQLRVFGTKGMVELVDGRKRRMAVTVDKAPWHYPDGAPSHTYPQDLIDCILDGTPTLLTQEDSFINTEVVLKARKSAATGQVVRM